jgi:hypothetical protein
LQCPWRIVYAQDDLEIRGLFPVFPRYLYCMPPATKLIKLSFEEKQPSYSCYNPAATLGWNSYKNTDIEVECITHSL